MEFLERHLVAQLQKALHLSAVFSLAATVLPLPVSSQAQAPAARPTFMAEHYDVSATLDANGQAIFATAKVRFRVLDASGVVRVELHPNLTISDVKSEQGASLKFDRDGTSPLAV